MKRNVIQLVLSAFMLFSSTLAMAQTPTYFSRLAKQKEAVCFKMSSADLNSVQPSAEKEIGRITEVSYIQLPSCKKVDRKQKGLVKQLIKKGFVELRSSDQRFLLFEPNSGGTSINCVLINSSDRKSHFHAFSCEEAVLNELIGQKMYGSVMAYVPSF